MTRPARLGRFAPVAALAALLLGSGCIFVNNEAPADLTFHWSFDGYDCGWAGVSTVVIQVWENDNTVSEVSTSCYDYGATLLDFHPGNYHYDLLGVTSGGQVVYEGSGDVYAPEGETVIDVDLWRVY